MTFKNPALEQEPYSAGEISRTKKRSVMFVWTAAIFLFSAGLGLIVWAASSLHFRDSENNLNAEFCLPLAAGLALLLNGCLINNRWRCFAFWAGLSLVGQAATLQMIDAGRLIHFQHYRTLNELLNGDFPLLLLLLSQTVFVAYGVRKRLPQIRAWLGKTFRFWQMLFISLFIVFSGAAVTPRLSVYVSSLIFAAVIQFVNLGNIVLAVWAVPEPLLKQLALKFQILFGADHDKPVGLDGFSFLAAVWIVLLAGTLSHFIYENHPHVPDETQYLFQARNMAAGQVTSAAPLVPEGFAMYMVPHLDERWYGIFPPAYPAILAIGVKLGAEWLVNPLLGGLCILLAYLFFQNLYSLRFARMAVFLLCFSPWFVFMAMSFMSHIFTLFCVLGAAVLLQTCFRKNNNIYAVAAGLAIGVVSLIRPLDGLIVAFLIGIWTLFSRPGLKEKIKTSGALIIGTVLSTSLVFPYNKSITGSATLLPMDAYYTKYFWKDVMALGFGANRGMSWGLDAFPGHSPLEAIINTALNIFSLNTEYLGWSTGSLLLVAYLVFSGNLRKRDFWAAAAIAVIVGGYCFFWYSGGPDFGARYWFLCIVPLTALTVRGMEALSERLDVEFGTRTAVDARVALAAVTLCVVALLCFFPWRALDKYYRYLEMQPGIRKLAEKNNFGKSLVLIRGSEHPDYQSAWIYNPLDFAEEAPLYAHDKNAEIRRRLLSAYPDRKVWVIEGPTIANGNYKVLRGPVSAAEILEEENY